MSASNDDPSVPIAPTRLSRAMHDLLDAGVMVELDPTEAEAFGAFAETALTEAEAWEANADLARIGTDDAE